MDERLQVIFSRRSIRQYTDQPVSEADLGSREIAMYLSGEEERVVVRTTGVVARDPLLDHHFHARSLRQLIRLQEIFLAMKHHHLLPEFFEEAIPHGGLQQAGEVNAVQECECLPG